MIFMSHPSLYAKSFLYWLQINLRTDCVEKLFFKNIIFLRLGHHMSITDLLVFFNSHVFSLDYFVEDIFQVLVSDITFETT